jgi:hypothetical protein
MTPSIWEMMMTRQFISIYVMASFSFFLGSFTVSNFKNYGIQSGLDETFLTSVGSYGAIFNAIRFVWSGLLDKYSYKVVYGSLLIL